MYIQCHIKKNIIAIQDAGKRDRELLTARDGFAENRGALLGIRDRRVFNGMKAFFSTIMLWLFEGSCGAGCPRSISVCRTGWRPGLSIYKSVSYLQVDNYKVSFMRHQAPVST